MQNLKLLMLKQRKAKQKPKTECSIWKTSLKTAGFFIFSFVYLFYIFEGFIIEKLGVQHEKGI